MRTVENTNTMFSFLIFSSFLEISVGLCNAFLKVMVNALQQPDGLISLSGFFLEEPNFFVFISPDLFNFNFF
jgi:hypothetical protein